MVDFKQEYNRIKVLVTKMLVFTEAGSNNPRSFEGKGFTYIAAEIGPIRYIN